MGNQRLRKGRQRLRKIRKWIQAKLKWPAPPPAPDPTPSRHLIVTGWQREQDEPRFQGMDPNSTFTAFVGILLEDPQHATTRVPEQEIRGRSGDTARMVLRNEIASMNGTSLRQMTEAAREHLSNRGMAGQGGRYYHFDSDDPSRPDIFEDNW